MDLNINNEDRFVDNFEDNFTKEVLMKKVSDVQEQASQRFMPIGTVVKIKNVNFKIMIIGFNFTDNQNATLDYVGCYYPYGIGDTSSLVYFNHIDVERIYHFGHFDIQGKKFQSDLCNSSNVK